MKTLREMIDIVEGIQVGWQDSEDTVIPDGLGLIQIGDRVDDKGEIVETMMNYFNSKVSNYDNGLVFGIRIKNDEIYEFDYEVNRSGKFVGDFKNRDTVKELFATRVSKYLSNFTRKIMENKIIQ
jgi:hypothetical protein